jgi:O-antigen ligase
LVLFVLGLMLVLDLVEVRKDGAARLHQWIRRGMLVLTVWLLVLVDSVTAQICLALGCLMFWGTGRLLRLAHPAPMLFLVLAVSSGLAILEQVFGLSGVVFGLLGRDSTLTGRVEIWTMIREHVDSLLGSGFYSFWRTPAGQEISEPFLGTLNTAHNGYLEMLLDGGVIGLALLVILLLVWARNAVGAMLGGTLFGRYTLVAWVLALLYNYSETSFFRMEPLWFTSLLTMIAAPGSTPTVSPSTASLRSTTPGAHGNRGRPAAIESTAMRGWKKAARQLS